MVLVVVRAVAIAAGLDDDALIRGRMLVEGGGGGGGGARTFPIWTIAPSDAIREEGVRRPGDGDEGRRGDGEVEKDGSHFGYVNLTHALFPHAPTKKTQKTPHR